MTNDSMVKKVYDCKPVHVRLAERPKSRWENDLKEDVAVTKIVERNVSRTELNGSS
jgi:hypothetical protein